ncbi:hypothetical protein QTI66_37745, partial [Variovorax sp. J22R133]|uniref:hypothetical protein n=1 Tax=Variovorax brevis TaxID=3053503 RepID=UPI002574A30A
MDRDIGNQPKAAAIADTIGPRRESTNVACVSVDSAWLNHHSTPKGSVAVTTHGKLRRDEKQSPCDDRRSAQGDHADALPAG